MQSSFRSCKRPEPINLLLTVGTDNFLAGTEIETKNNPGEASSQIVGQTVHHLRLLADTLATLNPDTSGTGNP